MIRLASQRRELAIEADGLHWAGPCDPEPDAPIVACHLPLAALEARAIAELVERVPVPSALLRELAERCPPGDDDGVADPRWRRARAAAAIARGAAAGDIADERGTRIDRGVSAMRRLPDGTLVRLRGTALAIGDAPAIALPVVEQAIYGLTAPLAADAIDPQHVVVSIYRAGHLDLLVFDSEGHELTRVEGPIDWLPDRVSHGRAGYWVHDGDHHALLGAEGTAGNRPYIQSGETLSARWLLAIDSQIAWISLDTAERRTFAWGRVVCGLARVDDVLWCTTPQGLWRLRGGEAPVLVWSGDVWGLAVDETHAWVGTTKSNEVVAIELATGTVVWRTRIAHSAHAVYSFPNGIVAANFWRFTLLASDGRVLAATDERRDVGVAQLADGTIAASAGEQVVIADADGSVRRALPMPYDGFILGATADRFVFGPVSGGVDHVRPTALVAFDRTGRITARMAPPMAPACIDDARVYVIDYNADELLAWDPRGTTAGIVPPPPRIPTERGARRVGYEVINPRDDWPEVGIEVHADFLALDGTYGGSVGQSREVALRVGDGAIATFVRCDLTIGGDGSIAERASTIFLIDCRLPDGDWSLGSACHLVILAGQIAGELRIIAAPTATVTASGVVARRAGLVFLLTSEPRGTPITVDGTRYAWEKDDRSGGLGFGVRGKVVSYIHITNNGGTAISFELPDGDLQASGWWRGAGRVTQDVIERAIRIATRNQRPSPYVLAPDEVAEAFDGAARTLHDELTAARSALDGLTRPDPDNTRVSFIRCLLAVGCCATDADREAIDDWVASHTDVLRAARAGLQLVVDETRTSEYLYANRSAIAFLVEMCARMNVDVGLDTTAADEILRVRFPRTGPRPWGIPASHEWWDRQVTADPR